MAKYSTVRARKRLELGENGQEVLYPLPYKTWTAIIAQTGTADPTATVLKNNLGGTIVLDRPSSAGVYTLTLVGAFTAQKTAFFLTVGTGSTAVMARAAHTSADVITVTTANASATAADLVGTVHIEIRVYA